MSAENPSNGSERAPKKKVRLNPALGNLLGAPFNKTDDVYRVTEEMPDGRVRLVHEPTGRELVVDKENTVPLDS